MNLTALLPTAFALALLNPAYAGSAPPASNLKNNTQQAGHSAQMVMKGAAKHQAGTYENPLQLKDDSSAAGLIYALIDSTGRRRFYESRFVGAPAEHELPPLPDGYSDFQLTPSRPSRTSPGSIEVLMRELTQTLKSHAKPPTWAPSIKLPRLTDG